MAAIHTGTYHKDIMPSPEAVERQWKLCVRYGEQYGNLMYIGLDENLNEVYTLGCRGFFDVVKKGYEGLNRLYKIDDSVWYVDCHSWDGLLTCIIARTNRSYKLEKISKSLFLYWLKKAYKSCAEKVQSEKRLIMAGENS